MKKLDIIPEEILQKLKRGDGVSDIHKKALELIQFGLNLGEFERSVGNCHTEGVDSIVLFDRSPLRDGMIRFYFARAGSHHLDQLYDTVGNYTVGIHNHRYNIGIVPLFGEIVNVSTAKATRLTDSRNQLLYEYQFSSALKKEGLGTALMSPQMMSPHEEIPLAPGQLHLMRSEDLHTIVVKDKPGLPGAAWMVIEGAHQPTTPLIYSPRPDLQISTGGLYLPISRPKAISIAEEVFRLAEKG